MRNGNSTVILAFPLLAYTRLSRPAASAAFMRAGLVGVAWPPPFWAPFKTRNPRGREPVVAVRWFDSFCRSNTR